MRLSVTGNTMKDLSVIIVNYNTRDLLQGCLTSVYSKPIGVDFDVWVSDNASADGSCEMLQAEFPQVNLIRNPENLGFARANNIAIQQSKSRAVLLLNSDTIVDPHVLEATYRLLFFNLDAAAVGCKLVKPNGDMQEDEEACLSYFWEEPIPHAGDIDENGLIQCAWLCGAYMMVKRKAIEHVGLLDENIFMYFEDQDWCRRMVLAGWKIFYSPDYTITHISYGSRLNDASHIYDYITAQSELYYYSKYHTPWQSRLRRYSMLFHHGQCLLTYGLRLKFFSSKELQRKFNSHYAMYTAHKSFNGIPTKPNL
jgi:GT2 family glycosyltransferase